MQATLLESVRMQLLYAEENVGEMERQVKEKQKELPKKELAVQKLKEQLTEAQAIGQLRQQEEVVTWKIAWHNVFVKRQDVTKYEGMLSTVRSAGSHETVHISPGADGRGWYRNAMSPGPQPLLTAAALRDPGAHSRRRSRRRT